MNRMHRTVWSEARQCHVVASEKTAARGKPASTRNAAAIAVAALMLHAAPTLATPLCTSNISTAMTETCLVTTTGDQTVTSTGSITAASGNGIMTIPVSGMGSIVNQGIIIAPANGIHVQLSSMSGSISNSGTIYGGASGIFVENSQVAGGIHNTASGLIQGGAAISINSSSFGDIVNEGTISGTAFGLQVLSGQGNRIVNSGTIEGSIASLLATPNTQLKIDIEGTHARFIGDVSAPDGDVTVKSGATFSNDGGFMVRNFTVENGASFALRPVLVSMMNPGGSGGINVSNGFINAGVVAPSIVDPANSPAVQPAIIGNYTQTGTGVLQVNVASDTSYGRLQVNGTATLPADARIDVNVTTPGYVFTADKLLGVLSATSLNSDGTFKVSDNSLLFDFGAVRNGNAVDLTISAAGKPDPGTPSGPSTVLGSVNARGNSPATGAARVLDQVIGSTPNGKLAGKFVGLTTQQQVSDAVTQTLPLLNGASTVAAGSALSGINRVVQARVEANRGLSAGDSVLNDRAVWVKPFGSWANQDDRDGVAGYKATTAGFALGADAAVNDRTRLGVALAYAHANVDGNSNLAPQSVDVDVFQLIGYGSYDLDERTALNFQLDAGQNRNSGRRSIGFADSTAEADYNSTTAHAGIGLGRTLMLREHTSFTPSVRADYTWIRDQHYTESGADALNLDVPSRSTRAMVIGVDGKLAHKLGEQTVISASLGVGYDTLNERASINAAYAGAPGAAFTTYGMDISPWMVRGGFGLTHTTASGVEITARYDAEGRSDFINQTASVKVRMPF